MPALSVGRFVAKLTGPGELAAVHAFNARRDIPGKVEALWAPFTAQPAAYASWGYWLFFAAGTRLPEGRECWGYVVGEDVYDFLSSHPRRPFTLLGKEPAAEALAAAFHWFHGVTRDEFEALLGECDFDWAADRVGWRGLVLTLDQIHDFRSRQLRSIGVGTLIDPFQNL